jgi:hypothetical protein
VKVVDPVRLTVFTPKILGLATAVSFFASLKSTRASTMLNERDKNEPEDLLNNICGKIQEEEFCQILDMRKNLQSSDVLIQFMSQYLSLGWQLAAVNSQNRVNQLLDFQEPKATWSDKLIDLSLDGIELNVGVLTGSASGLVVIEAQQQGRVFPFRRGDWSSQCVAEAGGKLEQHYYKLPQGWQLPASLLLEPFGVRLFGEGNLVMAPPSLEPQTQANWRWLKAPWDGAPTQLPPVLRKIIEFAAPDSDSNLSAPVIPSWEEIYPDIAAHPTVLQALMNPASAPESYYQHLLAAARAIGLKEQQLLLGLLWHAPLGDARERPQGWKYLQQLLDGVIEVRLKGEGLQADAPGLPRLAGEGIRALAQEPVRGVDSRHRPPPVEEDQCSRAFSGPTAISLEWPGDEQSSMSRRAGGPHQGKEESDSGWEEFVKASQENLVVERRRYEAMIYELGKLKVWQEICKQERRKKNSLNLKLEAQLVREVDYLRHLLKKNA